MLAQQNPNKILKTRPSLGNKQSPTTDEVRQKKRIIRDRLLAYRKKTGLSSVVLLAQASRVSDTAIYNALNSMPLSFDIWKRIEKGLDKLEKTSEKEKS